MSLIKDAAPAYSAGFMYPTGLRPGRREEEERRRDEEGRRGGEERRGAVERRMGVEKKR